ncbi:MAG: hypothetical protein AB8G15_06955 [Saprospiraceae bacterium]
MKKSYLIFLVLFMMMISCQENRQETLLEENLITATTEFEEPAILASLLLIESDSAILARRLQWMAYLSANVIRFNDAARMEVQELLENNDERTIPVNILIGQGATASAFSAAFNIELESYILGDLLSMLGRPDPQEDTPPRPVSERASNPVDKQVKIFLEYMTSDNCIELYFPRGFDFKYLAMTSTGHPMNLDPFNVGWIRYKKPIKINGKLYPTGKVKVDDTYVIKHQNIIVARPFIDVSNLVCRYPEYDIDFQKFLLYDE